MAGGGGRTRKCAICFSSTRNSHLGVEACRACAAFYKRTLTSGKKYICRQGNGQCVIRKHEPFLCRRCRFDKCVSLGMKLEGGGWSDLDDDSPSEMVQPTASTPAPNADTILRRISREYTNSCERRKQSELALRATSIYSNETVPLREFPQPIFLSTWEYVMDCVRMATTDLVQFCTRVFPEYSQLSLPEKQTLLKSFAGLFYLLEGNFLTEKIFPEESQKYLMASITSCFDIEDFDSFISKDVDEKRREELTKAMKFYTTKSVELTRPSLRKAALTDTEYHALLSILLWSFEHAPSIPENLVDVGTEVKNAIFLDLHRYYREELRLEEYASRLGQMMTLAHTLQEGNALLQEEFHMYKLLDLFTEDSFLNKLLG